VNESPLNYAIIERALRESVHLQDQLTDTFAQLGDELAVADVAFKKASAQSRVHYRDEMAGQKITEKMITDAMTLATVNEYETYELTRVKYESCKQRLYSVREKMNALRSLMASHRIATGDA
jgi:hypothetical protein